MHTTRIGNIDFRAYGCHTDTPTASHMNVAVAVGMRQQEIDTFCERLQKVMREVCTRHTREMILK
jgi:NifU-like protein involved in Fe-S cluster formation